MNQDITFAVIIGHDFNVCRAGGGDVHSGAGGVIPVVGTVKHAEVLDKLAGVLF